MNENFYLLCLDCGRTIGTVENGQQVGTTDKAPCGTRTKRHGRLRVVPVNAATTDRDLAAGFNQMIEAVEHLRLALERPTRTPSQFLEDVRQGKI